MSQLTVSKPVTWAAYFIIAFLIGVLLIAGRSILVPIVLALLIWHFLNAIHRSMGQIPKIGEYLPRWLRMVLTFVVVSLLAFILVNTISSNVTNVIQASSRYQDRFHTILNNLDAAIHYRARLHMNNLFDDWSFQTIFMAFYGVFTSITGSAILIGLYVAFIFVEQHFFNRKLNVLFSDTKNRDLVTNILKHIVQDTQVYLGLKTFLSLIAAFSSWVIMHYVGLDFSEFWALLIFFLNFIPNIGPIIATIFPTLLALIQFQNILPCVIITGGIVSIQFIIGNLIEPRFLSKSLNMSPLVILIALAFWGTVWGILGMFLAVPITVMIMIIFAHFTTTRPIAILLSQDGCIQKTYEKI